MAGGRVIECQSAAEWDNIKNKKNLGGTAVIVDFSATWCDMIRQAECTLCQSNTLFIALSTLFNATLHLLCSIMHGLLTNGALDCQC
jgi:hypothetical protein